LNHIGRHNSRVSAVFLPIPWDSISLPILLDGIAGNTEPLCRCPLACNTLQLQTAYFFVNIHGSYHLFFSSYNSVDPIVGHNARWLKYSLSFSGKVAQVDISIYRKAAGLSVHDLQVVFGFNSPQAIYKWQNGTALPTVDNLIVLAALLHVRIDDILVTTVA
jgi:hypothetical protein